MLQNSVKHAAGVRVPVFGCLRNPGAPRAVKVQAEVDCSVDRRSALLGVSAAVVASAVSLPAKAVDASLWRSPHKIGNWCVQVDLGLEDGIVLLDIAFTEDDPKHGFLIGTRQTLLETKDGGKTWEPRFVAAAEDEGINYRYNSISFSGSEGWIVGKPAILLHTTNQGADWERIPLSNKLPGTPIKVTALPGKGEAEMATDSGAIYVTNNAAYTWKAAVQETVDATLNRTVSSGISGASYYEGTFANIVRSKNGEYLGVSSRGNFYMAWAPGNENWMPFNRPANRRIQNIGWTPDDKIWVSSRGGDLLVNAKPGISGENFETVKIGSRGFGLLDYGFRTKDEAYACGGSGSLFKSTDGGKSFKRDRGVDQVPANLYAVKFTNETQGFVVGNDGILLRYIGSA